MGSSTSSVPKVQVDDAAIHGYVRAEVIEHRGDVILSEIANRAWSVSETRELNAHDSIVLKEERDRSRMHMVPLLSGSPHAAIITAVLPLKEKKICRRCCPAPNAASARACSSCLRMLPAPLPCTSCPAPAAAAPARHVRTAVHRPPSPHCSRPPVVPCAGRPPGAPGRERN